MGDEMGCRTRLHAGYLYVADRRASLNLYDPRSRRTVRKVNREASVNMASAGIRLVLRTLVSDGPELAGKLCDVLDLTGPPLSPSRRG